MLPCLGFATDRGVMLNGKVSAFGSTSLSFAMGLHHISFAFAPSKTLKDKTQFISLSRLIYRCARRTSLVHPTHGAFVLAQNTMQNAESKVKQYPLSRCSCFRPTSPIPVLHASSNLYSGKSKHDGLLASNKTPVVMPLFEEVWLLNECSSSRTSSSCCGLCWGVRGPDDLLVGASLIGYRL